VALKTAVTSRPPSTVLHDGTTTDGQLAALSMHDTDALRVTTSITNKANMAKLLQAFERKRAVLTAPQGGPHGAVVPKAPFSLRI